MPRSRCLGCCVFQPANGCSARRLLVKIIFLTLKQLFPPIFMKCYFLPLLCMILCGFPLIFCLFCSVSDGKSCFSIRKSILTSKRRAEHPFAGRNTQQSNTPFSCTYARLFKFDFVKNVFGFVF